MEGHKEEIRPAPKGAVSSPRSISGAGQSSSSNSGHNKSYVFIHPDGRREVRTYKYEKPDKIQSVAHNASGKTLRILARLGFRPFAFVNANRHLSDQELVSKAKRDARKQFPRSSSHNRA